MLSSQSTLQLEESLSGHDRAAFTACMHLCCCDMLITYLVKLLRPSATRLNPSAHRLYSNCSVGR